MQKLENGEHVIGRHQTASLRLNAQQVSSQHAKLRVEGARLFITELGSTNGTSIDGTCLRVDKGEMEVQSGSTIGCAEVLIQPAASAALDMTNTQSVVRVTQGTYRLDQGFSPAARERIADMLSSLFELIALDETSESLADKICEFLSRWLRADRVVLLEDNGEGTAVEPVGFWSREGIASGELKLSQTLVQRVIDERDSVLLVDVSAMDGDPSKSMVAMHLRWAMAVPLFDNHRVRGILYLDTAKPGERYNEDQLQMVTATANAVAIKLRNQSLASELVTAARIQNAIQPDQLTKIEGYDLLVRLDMCRDVAGDLYHVFPRPDGRTMLAVGDVAGKELRPLWPCPHV